MFFAVSPDKVIRHRACSLKDTAHAIFASELDPEFDRMCEDIKEARRKKGEKLDVFTFSVIQSLRSKTDTSRGLSLWAVLTYSAPRKYSECSGSSRKLPNDRCTKLVLPVHMAARPQLNFCLDSRFGSE